MPLSVGIFATILSYISPCSSFPILLPDLHLSIALSITQRMSWSCVSTSTTHNLSIPLLGVIPHVCDSMLKHWLGLPSLLNPINSCAQVNATSLAFLTLRLKYALALFCSQYCIIAGTLLSKSSIEVI